LQKREIFLKLKSEGELERKIKIVAKYLALLIIVTTVFCVLPTIVSALQLSPGVTLMLYIFIALLVLDTFFSKKSKNE
jgi:capsular polysaccharide biosynthesis protein